MYNTHHSPREPPISLTTGRPVQDTTGWHPLISLKTGRPVHEDTTPISLTTRRLVQDLDLDLDSRVMRRDNAGNLRKAELSRGTVLNGQPNEIEALQQRLTHAQRQIVVLKGSLMREKQARTRAENMTSNGADFDQEEGEAGEESEDTAGIENKKTKKTHTPFRPGRGRGRGVTLIQRLTAASRNDKEGARGSQSPEEDEVADTEQELEGMDPAFANVLRRGPLSGSSSPLRQSISGRPGGRGRKSRESLPFKDVTRPGLIVDDKIPGILDCELLGADVEGSRGEVGEVLKHVEGQTPLLDEAHRPQRMSEVKQATISARSATFFSSTNMSIYGGSFHLNVINGPDPTNMAGNRTNTAEAERNSRIQQSDLVVSDELLGIGSCGTVVHRGSFQGRPVAVKKLLRDFVTLAEREVSILLQSDNHPNVIQYYYQEARENFLFIAIELCSASLADIIEKPDRDKWRDIVIGFNGKKALEEITSGLDHLHDLNVVHRDIKPQNILISAPQRGRVRHRMLISDFGLCKKLDDDQGSFLPTTHGASAAGTRGWQAPEILRIKLEKFFIGDIWPATDTVDKATMRSSSKNLTKSMDIFPLGCLFYYTLTRGRHPFGGAFEREMNILRDTKDISGVELLGEEGLRAKDLIMRMLNPEPNERPDTTICLEHPYFMQFPTASARNPLPDD